MKMAYGVIRPFLVDWVQGRALRIPEKDLKTYAKKFGVSEDVVRSMEAELSKAVIQQLDLKVYGKVTAI